MQLEGIDHVAMGVRDIERSAKWYIDVLGFERLHDGMWNGVPTFIGKGNTGIALFPANEEPKTVYTPRNSNASPRLSCGPGKFSRCAAGPKEARNQIRIPGSRNRAFDLFPRPRRPPAGDYDVRRRVARRILRSLSCRVIARGHGCCRASAPLAGNRCGCPTIGALRDAGAAVRLFFPLRQGHGSLRRLLPLNAEPRGSVHSSELCELSGSGESKIWEG